jgi:hypothetical protein
VTGGTQAHPHWINPDDLWRDRLAILAGQGAWLLIRCASFRAINAREGIEVSVPTSQSAA